MKIMKMRIKKQQNNNIESKPLNIFDLNNLNQEAKDLMDKIQDANDDIDDGKFVFIGSNKENFNFNTLNKPLNLISAIYNGKTSLKEAEIKQRELEKKSKGAKRLQTKNCRRRRKRRNKWSIDESKRHVGIQG